MNAPALAVGVAFLLAAGVLVRFRAGIARWQIERRVDVLRHSSLLNDEYLQRQIDALQRPGSQQLSRLLVVVTAIFLAAVGALAIVSGVT